jgi:flagellin
VTGADFSLSARSLSSLASTDISVSTAAATTASNAIDTAITSLNNALATMGSQAAALDIQNDFLSKLSDTIEQGIGNLVDADLAKNRPPPVRCRSSSSWARRLSRSPTRRRR